MIVAENRDASKMTPEFFQSRYMNKKVSTYIEIYMLMSVHACINMSLNQI